MNDARPSAPPPESPAPSRAVSDAAALWRARYREDDDPAAQKDDVFNAVQTALMEHRSVRAFLPDALPDGALERAIACAQSAATSSNLQTWSVIAVTDPARKARLSELAGQQSYIRDCPLFLVWLADLARIDAIGEAKATILEGTSYLEALLLAVVDATLASQNASVAFESAGLGTVYIGAVRNKPEEIAAELGLPKNVFAVFGMCVGYPDPARPADIKPRLPQGAVLFREAYDAGAGAAGSDAYAARLKSFQREQGMREDDWRARVVERMRGAASLTGRDRMREALRALGFELR